MNLSLTVSSPYHHKVTVTNIEKSASAEVRVIKSNMNYDSTKIFLEVSKVRKTAPIYYDRS